MPVITPNICFASVIIPVKTISEALKIKSVLCDIKVFDACPITLFNHKGV